MKNCFHKELFCFSPFFFDAFTHNVTHRSTVCVCAVNATSIRLLEMSWENAYKYYLQCCVVDSGNLPTNVNISLLFCSILFTLNMRKWCNLLLLLLLPYTLYFAANYAVYFFAFVHCAHAHYIHDTQWNRINESKQINGIGKRLSHYYLCLSIKIEMKRKNAIQIREAKKKIMGKILWWPLREVLLETWPCGISVWSIWNNYLIFTMRKMSDALANYKANQIK